MNAHKKLAALLAGVGIAGTASAFTFEGEGFKGSFDSTVTLGTGVRTKSPSCSLVTVGAAGADAPTGCLGTSSTLGDQGNINYAKHDAFTTFLKGTHELLLSSDDGWKFMGRVGWLQDFSATHTTGNLATGTQAAGRTESLTSSARNELRFKARLLDLWGSKSFSLNGENARVRVGNQVISWGESMFIPGGINQTNAIDVMRANQPGTQLKEVFLPAPIASFATGLGNGFDFEAYVQAGWEANYMPPTGSYWSQANGLGAGHNEYGIQEVKPKKGGQFGAAMHWQPADGSVNLGLYHIRYQDKTPQTAFDVDPATGMPAQQWVYAKNRSLYGASANFQAGNWAFGTEISYRPKDAVALNPYDCLLNSTLAPMLAGVDGPVPTRCYKDEHKYQMAVTGIWSLTRADYGGFLKLLGNADSASLIVEAVGIRYPGLKSSYNGMAVAAGGNAWGYENDMASDWTGTGILLPTPGIATSAGSKNSWGYVMDFSWAYDGTLLPGWRVTPEIYYSQAVKGRTPNMMATFMEGAKSANFSVNFATNPASWQFGLNYSKFWRGKKVYDQPYADRDFLGGYVSVSF